MGHNFLPTKHMGEEGGAVTLCADLHEALFCQTCMLQSQQKGRL